MYMDITPETAAKLILTIQAIMIMLPSFFWLRGIVKSCKSDIVAGFILLCLLFLTVMITTQHISAVGVILLFFGAITFIVSPFAKSDCPIAKKDLSAIAMGFAVAGFFFSICL